MALQHNKSNPKRWKELRTYGTRQKKKHQLQSKKAKRQAPEDWIIVRNTHEPIINEDLFQKAQVLLIRPSRATTTGNGEKSLYSGFLYCEKCGHALSRGRYKDTDKCYQRCGFHEKTRKCRPIHISEKALAEHLLYAVKSQIVLITEMDKIKHQIISSGNFANDSKILQASLRQLEKERGKLEARSHRLYDDYSDGVIDKDLYISRGTLLKQELESAKDKIAKIQIEMRQFKKVQAVTDDYTDHFKKYETVNEITRELLVDLVDKVYIDRAESLENPENNKNSENPNSSNGNKSINNSNKDKQIKHVKVVFKFADEHKALTAFISENAQQQYQEMLVALWC